MKWDIEEARNTFKCLEELWNGRNIVIIEGAFSRLGVGNACFAKSKRIIEPAKHSFEKYNDILKKALSMDPNSLFILAMGPSATAMAAELADSETQALYMGHLDVEFEWLRMKAKTKLPINGKISNEAYLTKQADSEVIGDPLKEDYKIYKSQIIADFSE